MSLSATRWRGSRGKRIEPINQFDSPIQIRLFERKQPKMYRFSFKCPLNEEMDSVWIEQIPFIEVNHQGWEIENSATKKRPKSFSRRSYGLDFFF